MAYSEPIPEIILNPLSSLTIEDEDVWDTGLSTSKRGDSETSLSWKTRKLVVSSLYVLYQPVYLTREVKYGGNTSLPCNILKLPLSSVVKYSKINAKI